MKTQLKVQSKALPSGRTGNEKGKDKKTAHSKEPSVQKPETTQALIVHNFIAVVI